MTEGNFGTDGELFFDIELMTAEGLELLEAAIPQALAYMLGSPDSENPVFGFVTNGREFQFLKLSKQDKPKYALSYTLSLNRGDDLYNVLRALKRLGQTVIQ